MLLPSVLFLLLLIQHITLTQRCAPILTRHPPAAKTVPRRVVQTYISWDHVPEKVRAAIRTHCSGYEYVFFDDAMCESFLMQHFGRRVVEKYWSFALGAHRADLWRYCYMYVHGGIYMDIKTVMIRHLDEVFPNLECCYSVLSYFPETIYQGVLALPPGHPVMHEAIANVMSTPSSHPPYDYLVFTYQLYSIIARSTGGHMRPGRNGEWVLYSEAGDCPNDCSIVDEGGQVMFKTRYQDFRSWRSK
jgi:mannosyltransferase OCH1-like enzyme